MTNDSLVVTISILPKVSNVRVDTCSHGTFLDHGSLHHLPLSSGDRFPEGLTDELGWLTRQGVLMGELLHDGRRVADLVVFLLPGLGDKGQPVKVNVVVSWYSTLWACRVLFEFVYYGAMLIVLSPINI